MDLLYVQNHFAKKEPNFSNFPMVDGRNKESGSQAWGEH